MMMEIDGLPSETNDDPTSTITKQDIGQTIAAQQRAGRHDE